MCGLASGLPNHNLARVPLFLGAHNLDCGLCTTRRINRLLLCCSSCPAVAHLKRDGLRRSPDEEWHCASCLHSAALVPIPAASRAPLPAALPVAMPAALAALPAAMPAAMPVPLPAALPGILPAVPPVALPEAPLACTRGRPRSPVPSSGPAVVFAYPIPSASSHWLARAGTVVLSDLSARTGQRARLAEVARVSATIADMGYLVVFLLRWLRLFARSSGALAFRGWFSQLLPTLFPLLAYVRWPVALRHAFRLWAVETWG